jgi:cytochrome P450
MVVDEVLRLYPPAWVIGRTAIADDQISGFHIPAGSALVMSSWLTHRNALYWENPESFDPERFTPQRSGDRGAVRVLSLRWRFADVYWRSFFNNGADAGAGDDRSAL